jgi:phosphoribosyl 1,2-cyclic phosphodiesterase
VRGWTLGSGSRGNALLLESGGRFLLVDCGFGPRSLAARLRSVGVAPEAIEGLVITHEHVDHASGAARAQHKWRWPVYASAATLRALPEVAARWRRPVRAGERTEAGAFLLEAAEVPHDAAAPLAFCVTAAASGARVGIAHDLGEVPDGLPALLARCDALCLEANHNSEMLRDGPYPPALKARIRGPRGHLSNAQCGALAAQLAHRGLRSITLLHLSETNNTPEVAEREVRAAVRRTGYRGTLAAAPGRVPGAAFSPGGARAHAPAPMQLALGL